MRDPILLHYRNLARIGTMPQDFHLRSPHVARRLRSARGWTWRLCVLLLDRTRTANPGTNLTIRLSWHFPDEGIRSTDGPMQRPRLVLLDCIRDSSIHCSSSQKPLGPCLSSAPPVCVLDDVLGVEFTSHLPSHFNTILFLMLRFHLRRLRLRDWQTPTQGHF